MTDGSGGGLDRNEIDLEHRRLLVAYRELRASLEGDGAGGRAAVDVAALFRGVAADIRAHIGEEEALMAAHDYPEREVHAKEHRVLLARMDDILAFVEAGRDADDVTARFTVLGCLGTWLRSHIAAADRRFEEYLALYAPRSAASAASTPESPAR